MLYHVPDIDLALSQIQRVLLSGDRLYAAANVKYHLVEIQTWQREFFPEETVSN